VENTKLEEAWATKKNSWATKEKQLQTNKLRNENLIKN